MSDLSVNRTLVKSPPELWNEVSEVESLARHLGELGEITITRLEPEHTVAWEGEDARGTVELEASGWGTKVTLSAVLEEAEAVTEPEAEPVPAPRPGAWWSPRRWLRRGQPEGAPDGEVPAALVATEVFPRDGGGVRSLPEREHVAATLEATLDALGAAHHRPFSREG